MSLRRASCLLVPILWAVCFVAIPVQADDGIRALTLVEANEIRGAAPACDTSVIIINSCGDKVGSCFGKTQQQCAFAGGCVFCSKSSINSADCQNNGPGTRNYLCLGSFTDAGCGILWNESSCFWANNKCNCVGGQATGLACSQQTDEINDAGQCDPN